MMHFFNQIHVFLLLLLIMVIKKTIKILCTQCFKFINMNYQLKIIMHCKNVFLLSMHLFFLLIMWYILTLLDSFCSIHPQVFGGTLSCIIRCMCIFCPITSQQHFSDSRAIAFNIRWGLALSSERFLHYLNIKL